MVQEQHQSRSQYKCRVCKESTQGRQPRRWCRHQWQQEDMTSNPVGMRDDGEYQPVDSDAPHARVVVAVMERDWRNYVQEKQRQGQEGLEGDQQGQW